LLYSRVVLSGFAALCTAHKCCCLRVGLVGASMWARLGLVLALLSLCCHRPCMCHAGVLKQEMVAEPNLCMTGVYCVPVCSVLCFCTRCGVGVWCILPVGCLLASDARGAFVPSLINQTMLPLQHDALHSLRNGRVGSLASLALPLPVVWMWCTVCTYASRILAQHSCWH
jgi:hypothetical protein